jgi:hypothetical protein
MLYLCLVGQVYSFDKIYYPYLPLFWSQVLSFISAFFANGITLMFLKAIILKG